jgi:hypothetical protein
MPAQVAEIASPITPQQREIDHHAAAEILVNRYDLPGGQGFIFGLLV